jgi:hypothetical protein
MLQAGRSPVRVPDEVDFFNLPDPSSRTIALGSTQSLTKISTRKLPGGKGRPARRADNLATICESIVWKMWEPLRLTTLRTSTTCTGITLPYLTCVLFRKVSEIEIFHCTLPKWLIRKRYYVLFLIPVFIVQVTKLVQLVQCNIFSKIPQSTSIQFASRARTWRVARLSSSELVLTFLYAGDNIRSSVSETVRNRTRVHIHFFA